MTGAIYKEKVFAATGLRFNDVARKFGITTGAFDAICKSPDVKSGYIEKAIEVLGMKVSDFYECAIPQQTIVGTDENGELVRYLLEQNKILIETNLALAKGLAK